MDEPTRRAWSKPELIVIVRGGQEEAVLTACKDFSGIWPATSEGKYNYCWVLSMELQCTPACNSIASS